MLSVKAVDATGNVQSFFPTVSVRLSKEEDVPADICELSFAELITAELAEIEVSDGSKLIFCGAVDEQITEESTSPHTEIVARSFASRLIDNEAYPMSFVNPSAQDIYEHYIKPCKINMTGENRAYTGRFTVPKGSSCFAVVRRFCKDVYKSFPRVEGDTLYLEGIVSDDTLLLSNTDGVNYESLRVANLRCNRVSAVYAKLKENGGYTAEITDGDAQKSKINTVRYLNASFGSSTPLSEAENILKDSRKNSFYVTVKCKGNLCDALGKAVVIDGHTQNLEGLYVSALKYTLNKNGEHTTLTLKRKES